MISHIGRSDILMMTLDTLRYDVAQRLFDDGRTPNLASVLPRHGWQRRHSPASFTYAAHHAFFAGFLPTPTSPGPHMRLYASDFGGSETTGPQTFTFGEATLPEALKARGYQTICIGGTGFFNPVNVLGRVLPELFEESHWSSEMSVVGRESPIKQVDCAIRAIEKQTQKQVFCFINFSAIHQPNWFFEQREESVEGHDTVESHGAALEAIDREIPRLLHCFRKRGGLFAMIFSDHGTAYGEQNYWGHRLGHPVVWEVPYADFHW
ncbi:MAG: STM4013/SEN3800 family hydrolase [Planctomycetota bacterium]